MHGRAFIVPLVTRVADVDLPHGFRAIGALGRTAGLCAYIEYEPPSPLSYRELIFMPALVRSENRRGYFVSAMYVDDTTTLVAGRREWALPKELASFDRQGDIVRIEAKDGAVIEVTLAAFGPAVPFRGAVATLQRRSDQTIRFKSSFRGSARIGRVTLRVIEPSPAWRAFGGATSLPSGVALHDFTAVMHAPRVLGG
jgi:hypothetical protein